jgi:hypothetical protein
MAITSHSIEDIRDELAEIFSVVVRVHSLEQVSSLIELPDSVVVFKVIHLSRAPQLPDKNGEPIDSTIFASLYKVDGKLKCWEGVKHQDAIAYTNKVMNLLNKQD